MLSELQNLVPTKKEKQLQVFINQLTNELYNNEKIEVDSKKLLELLSYLTSNENISKQMESAVEDIHRRTIDILNKKQTEKFKDYIKYLEENSIPKQKIKDLLKEIEEEYNKVQEQFDCIWNKKSKNNYDRYKLQELSAMQQELGFILGKLEQLLEDK